LITGVCVAAALIDDHATSRLDIEE
jgi:hypothetical protein